MVVMYFRRDLRLHDNRALYEAQKTGIPILPIFIFDDHIIRDLPKDDARISFMYSMLQSIDQKLQVLDSTLHIYRGSPLEVWQTIIAMYDIKMVFANEDYEPYATDRDQQLRKLFAAKGIEFHLYKDQVLFHKNEIIKEDGLPYTMFTPYKKKWLSLFTQKDLQPYKYELRKDSFVKAKKTFPKLEHIGYTPSTIPVPPITIANIKGYALYRNFPALAFTTGVGPHLRFGIQSIRHIASLSMQETSNVLLSELIWRDFFMQILYHFPHVVTQSFRAKYDRMAWRNDKSQFDRWKQGNTGFPLVDAGMRQLAATGAMHNRVRMVVASFLCKHLLIDWRWGEAYFAEKLVDFELASNNGNWQWAAGTGCDAAPYFRIFNPTEQAKKFDTHSLYIKKWLPEWQTTHYPSPIVVHEEARKRAIAAYQKCLASD